MQREAKIPFCFLNAVIACGICFASASSVNLQDVVVLKKSSGEGETKRTGEIVEWVGDVITIRGRSGLKEIDTQRLIRIETAWHPAYQDGLRSLAEFQYDQAIEQFDLALDAESRAWMRNIIFSKQLQCYLAKEDFAKAARCFFEVIDDDPQSRFRHLVPLVWTSSRPSKRDSSRAADWMESKDPLVAMLGASWLLNERSNEKAKQTMERLAGDFDPTVAALATAQLWRLDTVAADEKRLAIRIKQVQAMPEKVRCGAWYLIAETQSKLKKSDDAIINFMRIPVNDSAQGSLAAAALYQSAWLLDNTDRKGHARVLRNELREKFGDTVWAN